MTWNHLALTRFLWCEENSLLNLESLMEQIYLLGASNFRSLNAYMCGKRKTTDVVSAAQCSVQFWFTSLTCIQVCRLSPPARGTQRCTILSRGDLYRHDRAVFIGGS
ncbi:hypothetical protein RRG08_040014 [Elysia crispata]|uniref:Uncharacterized protein n=1 Tax=Elysia crispata TaxID=231223 RepID=A0AAE0Z7X5_9GAST|nr:hypothetical protein RRG08_040014 [Elysia crispata]